MKNLVFPDPFDAIIFIANVGFVGYIIFNWVVVVFIFNVGFPCSIGVLFLFISPTNILNLCFIFGFVDSSIIFSHLSISNAFPCFTLRYCSSNYLLIIFFRLSCSEDLFFCFMSFSSA